MTDDLDLSNSNLPVDRTLLLVEDDTVSLQRLGKAIESRGFEVTRCSLYVEAVELMRSSPPAFAVVDMRLSDGNGLDLIKELSRLRPDARIVMLTGYGSFVTAVCAIKYGAVDCLSKPADADEVLEALCSQSLPRPPADLSYLSAARVAWEHIQRVYELCDRNVSETARRLRMHRRTLQRILSKRAPR